MDESLEESLEELSKTLENLSDVFSDHYNFLKSINLSLGRCAEILHTRVFNETLKISSPSGVEIVNIEKEDDTTTQAGDDDVTVINKQSKKRSQTDHASKTDPSKVILGLNGAPGRISVTEFTALLINCLEIGSLLSGSSVVEKGLIAHAATYKDQKIREISLDVYGNIISICLESYHSIKWILNQLDLVSLSASTKKMKKENRQQFESSHQNLTLEDLLPIEGEGIKYSRQCHRIVRLLEMTLFALLTSTITHLVSFCDDVKGELRAKTIRLLTHACWDIPERCCPYGILDSRSGMSSFQCLEACKSLCRGFIRFSPPDSMVGGNYDDIGSYIPIGEVKATVPTDFVIEYSESKWAYFVNKCLQKDSDLIDSMGKASSFLCAVNSNKKGTLFEQLKATIEIAQKSIVLFIGPDGWVIRALEDLNNVHVRLEAARFLNLSFKHDKHSLEPSVKFNFPVHSLLWDAASTVQEEICDSIIALSKQLPFKDGAFRRFGALLLSSKWTCRKIGLRLMAECQAINALAVSQALRTLMLVSNPDYKMLSKRIAAAAQIVDTNATRGVDALLRTAQDVYIKNCIEETPIDASVTEGRTVSAVSSSSTTAAAVHISFGSKEHCIIFSAYALRLLTLFPEKYIKTIPSEVLSIFEVLHKRLPNLIITPLKLFTFPLPPADNPLFVRFNPSLTCKAFAYRAVSNSLIRSNNNKSDSFEIISALEAAVVNEQQTDSLVALPLVDSSVSVQSKRSKQRDSPHTPTSGGDGTSACLVVLVESITVGDYLESSVVEPKVRVSSICPTRTKVIKDGERSWKWFGVMSSDIRSLILSVDYPETLTVADDEDKPLFVVSSGSQKFRLNVFNNNRHRLAQDGGILEFESEMTVLELIMKV